MKTYTITKRVLSLLLATALLLCCAISGIVLPVSAASENLLGNAGTFDDATIDYTAGIFKTPITAGAAVVDDPGDATNKVLQYKGGSTYLNLGSYVEDGVTYKFTCRMKGKAGVSGITAGTKKLNDHTVAANGDTVEALLVDVTEEWQTLTRYFTAGGTANFNSKYTIAIQSKSDTVYYDDFTLSVWTGEEEETTPDPEPDPEPTPTSGELLGDYGTFDNTEIDYTTGVFATVMANGGSIVDDTGNKVLKFTDGTTQYLRLGDYAKEGVGYKFTCRVKGGEGVSASAGTRTNKVSATNGDTASKKMITVTEEWQTITRYFVAKSDMNYLVGVNSPDAAVYYDDFTLTPLQATEVSLEETLTLGKGASATLTPTVAPVGAQYNSISWSSSDTTVATVDENGTVTALDVAGSAVITATIVSDEGTFTTSCTVTVGEKAESITLSHTSLHLCATFSASQTVSVVASPDGAYMGAITWSSSNTAVATVDANGKVTAVADGTAVITASSDLGFSATCTVTVDAYGERIVGGDFETDDHKITQWQTQIMNAASDMGQATVVIEPGNETNHVLKMANGKTATMYYWDSPLAVGQTYTLTFRAKGGHVSTYIHPSRAVSGDRGKIGANLSDTEWTTISYTFTTVAENLNRNYVFGFSNTGDGDVYMDDVSLKLLPKATALSVSPAIGELFPGRSMTLSVSTTPSAASAGVITWTSSDDTIVTVDANGVVTAVGESGTATITGVNPDGLTVTSEITVTEYANLLLNGDFEEGSSYWDSSQTAYFQSGIGKDGSAGLLLSTNASGGKQDFFYKTTLPLAPASRYILTFDYKLSNTSTIRVWSGNIGCSFTPDHSVRGEWVSTSLIFTTPVDMTLNTGWDLGLVADTDAAVVDNVELRLYSTGIEAESIVLSQSELLLAAGISKTLSITATPADSDLNRTVWTSSDESVVTVQNGKVTAVDQGTATVTATTKNGKTASCTITVMKATSLVLDAESVTLTEGESVTLTATAFLKGAETTAVTWKSSDTNVVTVADGKLVAGSVGTATVTASVTDRVTASCVVTVVYSDPAQSVYSNVTVADDITNGTVAVSTPNAANGEAVTVTVTPVSGYQTVPGSVKYITADGTVHRILNKASGDFGEGDGTQFVFTMPVGAVTVTAAFEPTTTRNFRFNAVGTSLYHNNDGETVGIRFLTRLYFDNVELNADAIEVTLDNNTYTVKEFGTLLKRSLNPTELNLENYDSTNTASASRLWKAQAYDGTTMKLVDHTASYLDFTVIMKTSTASDAFYSRYYDARGYIVLDNGTVLYTDVFTDSPADAETRLQYTGSMVVSKPADIGVTGPEDAVSIDPVTADVRNYLTIAADDNDAAAFWSASHSGNDTLNTVTLQWEEDGSAQYRVLWSTDATFATGVRSTVVSECEYKLPLLVPGNTYYWKVRNARGIESEVRSVTVEDGPRWIDADGGRNIRDLGGWTAADGQTTKYELLYRGACIDGYNGIELTEEGIRVFTEELGIKTEIDLRGSDDGESGGQTESDFGGVYVKAVMDQYDYIFTSATTKTSIGKIMEVLSDESNYPIYFHCNAGADRTGTLAFLINGLLGVSYDDLTRDFEMTGFGSTGNRLRSKLDTSTGTFDDSGVMQNSGNYIAWGPLYEKMMSNYGTEDGTLSEAIENFLKTECGVTDDEINAIRTLLLE